MKCKKCKRDIVENSIFCSWCGTKQIKEVNEVKVPKATKVSDSMWRIQFRTKDLHESVYAETEEKCIRKAIALKQGFLKQEKNGPNVTIGEMVDTFIAANSNVMSPATVRSYKSIRTHRFQRAMELRLSQNIDWQREVNSEALNVSPKTLENAWRLITASMRYSGITPPNVNLPKKPKPKKNWLDYDQIQTFLSAIYETDCELGALLALHSLRRSEIFDLTSDDIDLDKGTIRVHGSVVSGPDGTFVRKETNKNSTSDRTVQIVIPRLEELLNDKSGLIMDCSVNALYFRINKICEKNGLPKVGVHGLRHSFCSLAYHLKWSEASTMAYGGWSDTKVVHDVYTHLAQTDHNEDIERMRKFYSTEQNAQ